MKLMIKKILGGKRKASGLTFGLKLRKCRSLSGVREAAENGLFIVWAQESRR